MRGKNIFGNFWNVERWRERQPVSLLLTLPKKWRGEKKLQVKKKPLFPHAGEMSIQLLCYLKKKNSLPYNHCQVKFPFSLSSQTYTTSTASSLSTSLFLSPDPHHPPPPSKPCLCILFVIFETLSPSTIREEIHFKVSLRRRSDQKGNH